MDRLLTLLAEILGNTRRLSSPRAWRLVSRQVRESLGPKGAAFLTFGSLFTIVLDIVKTFSALLVPILFCAILAGLFVVTKMVARPRPKKMRKALGYAFLASLGVIVTSSILLFSGNPDLQRDVGTIVDNTDQIKDTSRQIAASTSNIEQNTEFLSASAAEEKIAMQLTFRLDKDDSNELELSGDIIWPPYAKPKKNSCKFVIGNDAEAPIRYFVDDCFNFRAEISPDTVSSDPLSITQAVSTYPWLEVEFRDGEKMTIPAFNMLTPVSTSLTKQFTQSLSSAAPEDLSIEFFQTQNIVTAEVMSDGKPFEDGRCQWQDRSNAIVAIPIDDLSCKVSLEFNPSTNSRSQGSTYFMSATVYGSLSQLAGNAEAAIPAPLMNLLVRNYEKQFDSAESHIDISNVVIDHFSFEQVHLNFQLESARELDGEFFDLTGLQAFRYDQPSDYLHTMSATIDGRLAGNAQTIIGGPPTTGNITLQETPNAIGFCITSAFSGKHRMTLEIWKPTAKGFKQEYAKTYTLEHDPTKIGRNTPNGLSCKNTINWPGNVIRSLANSSPAPSELTVGGYRKLLITNCRNAPDNTEALLFCLKNGLNGISSTNDWRSRFTNNSTVNLSCTALHRLYVDIVQGISRRVTMPPIPTPPFCDRYGEAAEQMIGDMEDFIDQYNNRTWRFDFEPYSELAKTCRIENDVSKRLEACDFFFTPHRPFLQHWREQCGKYGADRMSSQYEGAITQQRRNLGIWYGDRATFNGANRSNPFQRGLETDSMEWYLAQIETWKCPASDLADTKSDIDGSRRRR